MVADEYRKTISKDAALERRFQPVTIEEPTVESTISILRGLKPRYEVRLHNLLRRPYTDVSWRRCRSITELKFLMALWSLVCVAPRQTLMVYKSTTASRISCSIRCSLHIRSLPA
jgi:hypothetical protein